MKRKRILVVDDYHDILEMLALFVHCLGYEPIAVRTGRAALEMANSLPELILLDLALPDISGLEVATILKQNPKTAAIPIVILTALLTDSWREAAKRAGVSEMLSKPCSLDELRRVLKRFAHDSSKRSFGGHI
jgi:CheY-like chemotaxis protein